MKNYGDINAQTGAKHIGDGSLLTNVNTSKNINQTTHGFTVGKVLKFNGTTYAVAQADSAADAEVVGIVSVVIDVNNFTLLVDGYVTGLSSLTAGTTYFLSPSSSGALTATVPTTTGQISLPLLIADTTTSGFFHRYRGQLLGPSSIIPIPITSGGTGQITATAAINALLPSQTSNSGLFLTTDATNTSWAAVATAAGNTTFSGTNIFSGAVLHTGFDKFTVTDTNTGTYTTPLILAHDLSTGTAAPGFGIRFPIKLQSSTTIDQDASAELTSWVIAADATRKARKTFLISDTAEREALRIEASGTAPMIGFLGSTAVAQQSGDVGTALFNYGLLSSATLPPYSPGFLFGLGMSNDATTPNTTIDVAAGSCRNDINTTNIDLVSAPFLKILQSSGAWAAGTGSNGLDTGAKTNSTWYHVFIISQVGGTNPDILFSLSLVSPTMPGIYTLKRRIGSVRTDSSGNMLKFSQNGDEFFWAAPISDVSATNPGTAAVTRTLTVPINVKVKAQITVGYSQITPTTDQVSGIYITDLALTDVSPIGSASTFVVYSPGTASQSNALCPAQVWTNTSGQVRSRLQLSAAGSVLTIVTNGWIDQRGRNS